MQAPMQITYRNAYVIVASDQPSTAAGDEWNGVPEVRRGSLSPRLCIRQDRTHRDGHPFHMPS